MKDIIECCCAAPAAAPVAAPVQGMATPANTIGMGDVDPEVDPIGATCKAPNSKTNKILKNKKKHKMIVSLKKYVQQHINS